MDAITTVLGDEAASLALGRALARWLEPGDVLLLHGDLGAGKTTLARGIIEAFCGIVDAPSPTYTLVQSYTGKTGTPLLHADLYRLGEAGELEELGLDEAFEQGVCLIEWPDRLGAMTPMDRIDIRLSTRDQGGRDCRMDLQGRWSTRRDRIASIV
ncbi:MAG: tRNA (adenosine(37)-N6)-threonylcarbamoyltransferase complex ATPase subunit type 1 TsaE [Pseudomonadota bacterium]